MERYKNHDTYAADPVIDEEEWNNLLDVIDRAGELQEQVPSSAIVDNTFAEQAVQNVKR